MRYGFLSNEKEKYICVCFERNDRIDALSFGMIANNNIDHIIPFSYRRNGMGNVFYYNVSGLVSLSEYIRENCNVETLKTLYLSVCDVMEEAEEYMLKTGALLWDENYIYVEPFSREIKFMLVPSATEVMPGIDIRRCMICFLERFRDDRVLYGWMDDIGRFLYETEQFSAASFRDAVEKAGSSFVKRGEYDGVTDKDLVDDPDNARAEEDIFAEKDNSGKKSLFKRLFPGKAERKADKTGKSDDEDCVSENPYYADRGYGETVVLRRIS